MIGVEKYFPEIYFIFLFQAFFPTNIRSMFLSEQEPILYDKSSLKKEFCYGSLP
jgi:hypothetical protein